MAKAIPFRFPKVIILLTTYKDPPLFSEICLTLTRTEYPNIEILLVDCRSTKIKQILENSGLQVPIRYILLKKDMGAAHQLDVGMQSASNAKDAKYVVRIEGDAIPLGPHWLSTLVSIMESDPSIAIAMPFDTDSAGNLGYGGRLYGNGTQSPISKPSSNIVPCLGTGGHCIITRTAYLKELFEKGIMPYWTPLFISSEDLDFNLKAWLRSYKVVTVGSARVLHEGTSMTKNGSYRAPYRIYHMYKNRMCLLVLNFSFRHIVTNIWYRFLHDIISALLYSEFTPLFRGYLWVIANLKEILKERRLRMVRWKRISDDELKRFVLVRLPMPIRRQKIIT